MLNVIEFERKQYKFEEGEFLLKPPYLALKDKATKIYKSLFELFEKNKEKIKGMENLGTIDISDAMGIFSRNEDTKEIEIEIRKIMLKFLHLVLEGDVKVLTLENLRSDVFNRVFSDFFSQFK